MSFLLQQDDWDQKSMVLVVDDSLYSVEKKMEIIDHWIDEQKRLNIELLNSDVGRCILEEQKNYVDEICNQIEKFLMGVSRRKNPSQIAVVNEIIKKSERNKKKEISTINKREDSIRKYLAENGGKTLGEISIFTGMSNAATHRYIVSLIEKGYIERIGPQKGSKYFVKE